MNVVASCIEVLTVSDLITTFVYKNVGLAFPSDWLNLRFGRINCVHFFTGIKGFNAGGDTLVPCTRWGKRFEFIGWTLPRLIRIIMYGIVMSKMYESTGSKITWSILSSSGTSEISICAGAILWQYQLCFLDLQKYAAKGWHSQRQWLNSYSHNSLIGSSEGLCLALPVNMGPILPQPVSE